jgi:hypothetical protein
MLDVTVGYLRTLSASITKSLGVMNRTRFESKVVRTGRIPQASNNRKPRLVTLIHFMYRQGKKYQSVGGGGIKKEKGKSLITGYVEAL